MSLPINHPQAGYVGPDLSEQDTVGVLPTEEQTAYDDQVAAREAEVAAVEAHEAAVIAAEEEPEVLAASKTSSKTKESSDS
jgi:hypothetical protein